MHLIQARHPHIDAYASRRVEIGPGKDSIVSLKIPSTPGRGSFSSGQAPTPGQAAAGDAGWAVAAGIVGVTSSVLVLGLGIASAATMCSPAPAGAYYYSCSSPSTALGASATAFLAAGVPVTAYGGSTARNSPKANGIPALRVSGWVAYGLSIVGAITLLAIEASGGDLASAGAGPILATALVGTASGVLFTADAFIGARQAKKLGPVSLDMPRRQPSVVWTPTLQVVQNDGRATGSTVGILGRF